MRLCPSCRRQLADGARHCTACGAPLRGAPTPLELVLPDGRRVALVEEVSIGRGGGASLVLADATVSRLHARIDADGRLSDAGSTYGTFLDGERVTAPVQLRDGVVIGIGDQVIVVERRRADTEAGRTLVVRPGASLHLAAAPAPDAGIVSRPRLRSGYALKRLDASEGPRRWVLRDLREDRFHHLEDADGELLQLLDGTRTLHDLVGEAEQRLGGDGPVRLAQLISELGERGRLAGGGTAETQGTEAPRTLLRRMVGPREKVVRGFGAFAAWIYDRGGWTLFTTPALMALAILAASGLIVFVAIIALVYGKPFVVAERVGLGAAVFILGRFAVAAVHELAHALAMASVGRQVPRAGIKFVAIFPYVFVDTSEAWFESRERRITVSLAGPVSDLALGGAFAIGCALAPEGALRDIFFNLAFGAYLGAFFNLNPLVDRDGYHVLSDLLREPNLRRRGRERIRGREGSHSPETARAVSRYVAVGCVWTILGALAGYVLALHYEDLYADMVGATIRRVLMVLFIVLLLMPALLMVVPPLVRRVRRGRPVTAATS